MDIMFEIVSRQKFSASFPTAHVFGEAGGYMGRAEECEWVLPDRTRQISRQHALVTFDDGYFYIEDVSANGVFLSLGHELLGKGVRHRIEHGEGFAVGEYTIMARLLHNPSAYAEGGQHGHIDIAGFANSLSLNPLTAMEQEEEMGAKARMGDFDDLLRVKRVAPPPPADHSDPLIGRLQPIVSVDAQAELIPEDWDAEPEENLTAPLKAAASAPVAANKEPAGVVPVGPVPTLVPTPVSVAESGVESGAQAGAEECHEFFRILGFVEVPASAEERRRILQLAAELLVTCVDGMSHAMRDRAACKNELRLPATTTSLAVNNNPLKFSPTSEAALGALLGPAQKGVLPPLLAMQQSFMDLHSHHMGLLAGARASTRALLDKLAPQKVEARLDMDGPVRFGRTRRLWHTYTRIHRQLSEDQQGLAGFLLHDFARAYEVQGRTLNPKK